MEISTDNFGDLIIGTYTGKRINLFDLKKDDIDIEDVAHALSRGNRFNGHMRASINVAQHSCTVHDLLQDKEDKRSGLFHDLSEAFVGDMITPVKDKFPFFREIEAHIMNLASDKFSFHYPLNERVKYADYHAYLLEVYNFANLEKGSIWRNTIDNAELDGIELFSIENLGPDAAKQRFLSLCESS